MIVSTRLLHLRRTVALLGALVLLAHAVPSHAVFHLAVIDEVMTSYDGDPEVQFVEIRMLAILQSVTSHTVLSAFDASGDFVGELLVVPSNVPRNGAGLRWMMGTQSFATVSGVSPDFIMTAGLPLGGGMVCWGAPGVIPPTDPTSWDHGNPANYVDCLAYGNYAGPTNSHIGTPTALLPEGHSLVRSTNTRNNLIDFACNDPATPTNNAGSTTTLPATSACFAAGDLNHDLEVNADDLPGLFTAIFSDSPPPEADVNADERVGAADVIALVRIAAAA